VEIRGVLMDEIHAKRITLRAAVRPETATCYMFGALALTMAFEATAPDTERLTAHPG
jgi:hypothetical protein